MPNIQIIQKRPSAKTLDYMRLLFNDVGYTPNQSILFCRNEFNRPSIKYLDDLTQQEASQVIDRLKEIRERIRQ